MTSERSKITNARILGMTLGEFSKLYIKSTLGKVSLAFFTILIVMSIYALIVIPPNFGFMWNTPSYWTLYPKNAPPAWINYIVGNIYAPQITSSNFIKEGNQLVLTLTLSGVYSRPWQDLFIEVNSPALKSLGLVAYVYVYRPDGSSLTLGPVQLSSGVNDIGSNPNVANQVTLFFLSKYGYQLSALESSTPFLNVFYQVSSGNLVPLKGTYTIKVVLTPTSGQLPNIKPEGSATVVIQGQSYGIMGTDTQGHDLWLGLLAGFPLGLEVGVVITLIGTVISVSIGLIAGFLGGIVDEILTRIMDFLILLPTFVILVVLSVLLRLNVWQALLFGTVLGWGGGARIIRAMTLQIKNSAYADLAKAAGASNSWIIRNHILPQLIPFIVYSFVAGIPGTILSMSSLNFLNLATSLWPTWGLILYYAEEFGALESGMWWWVVPPGLLIAFVAITFIITALAMEPIVNPRLRR
ncbi:MAG: ABC transporter permease [Caldivirga sp.]|uniref:ABC transporter permease n=1 Tax=Caldivirga sp. TaxID=2080243 RepID=UPI003D0FE06A